MPATSMVQLRKEVLPLVEGNSRVLILGQEGIGKAVFVSQFLDGKPSIHIPLRKVSLNPENFAVEYVEASLSQFLKRKIVFENAASLGLPDEAAGIVKAIGDELLKIKPDQKTLVMKALSFPGALARGYNKTIFVWLEDAEELLQLQNYAALKQFFTDALDLMKEPCRYILTSSAMVEMSALFARAQFRIIRFDPLSRDDAFLLMDSLAKLAAKEKEILYERTNGVPQYISLLLHDYKKGDDIQGLFTKAVQRNGSIHLFCSLVFERALSRARGQTLLQAILKTIAQRPPLSLPEIARKIYRPAPVAKALLERLISVDIIIKEGKKFHFADPIMHEVLKVYFAMEELS